MEIILFKILKSKPNLPPTLTLRIGLYYFNNEKSRSKIVGGGEMLIFYLSFSSNKQVYFFFFQMNEFLVIWSLKSIKIFVKVKLCFSNA